VKFRSAVAIGPVRASTPPRPPLPPLSGPDSTRCCVARLTYRGACAARRERVRGEVELEDPAGRRPTTPRPGNCVQKAAQPGGHSLPPGVGVRLHPEPPWPLRGQ